jgi:hypothetical protein
MTLYKLIAKFDIDNGELDGIAPHEIFVLGVEYHMVMTTESVKSSSFEVTLHTHNVSRVVNYMTSKNRATRVMRSQDGWAVLHCGKPSLN